MARADVEIQTVTYQDAIADIQSIRRQVFQEEQGVAAALEFDGLDAQATHLLAIHQGVAVGTTRIRRLTEDTAKIERVAVLAAHRGEGIGRQLMHYALDHLKRQGIPQIKVNAQLQVQPFYESLGFKVEGEVFEEAGIPHVTMWRL